MTTAPLPPRLVLASASPARKKLLLAVGIEPSVVVSSVDEDAEVAAARTAHGDLAAEDVALLLARAKAENVAAEVDDALVVGCDSVLELDGEIHGKPSSPDEAVQRWQRMRGSSGVLHTGHWVVDTRDPDSGGSAGTLGAVASTTVHFADLSDEEVESYVATGEPLRVAGAFTLDGLGGAYVTGIEGDPANVVGLSLPLLRELLAELGVAWHELRSSAHHDSQGERR